MAYVRVPDPRLDNNKPGRSTDLIGMRDNQDDFDSRLQSLELLLRRGDQDIRDDFISKDTAVEADNWIATVGSGDTASIVSEHKLRCVTNGNALADGAVVGAATRRQRIVKTEEYVAFFECRVNLSGTLANNYAFGWNVDSLGDSLDLVSDQSDCVIVVRDTFDIWSLKVVNASSGATVGGVVSVNAWRTVRIEFTCSATAGSRKVELFTDGTSRGTVTDNSKMPTGVLRPFAGCRGDTTGAASRQIDFDSIDVGFLARPVAA